MNNRVVSKNYKGELPAGDQSARFRVAWDEENLYLRVEVEDDRFLVSPELWERPKAENSLWVHDGALEVYFDTGADGRTNLEKTFDDDDYRYDFSISKTGESGPGQVNRFREVYHQLADGIHMPTKAEVAEKVVSDFQRTETGYTYTITFGQRYLEPLMLRKGFTSGFALYLHDNDEPMLGYCPKGLSLATQAGAACDYHPELWPLMILSE
ncbi:sugar-binding protein [Coraliomargarita algicola]|uniref:Sugar-binding protein n=1 Tax=Coraliomargarita algicola TaxID=3092156 RepID=A0ABZ0RP94_9BACT|nr:sugar-binding protein [Coraliomargarita sp. J2-16]WPJ97347.1 sugar-binding protein [Coraliomargarita sp. J2-16]